MQAKDNQNKPDHSYRGRLVFVTGGARSGKSRYAQERALEASPSPVYVATARHWDGDFAERIRRHQQDRDERWTSLEEEKYISRLPLAGRVAIVDCVTLWLTNFFLDTQQDIEQSLDACKNEMDILCREALSNPDTLLLIVSNEIGMGVHAETEAGRKFTDLQGWMNQYIAGLSTEVILMVSGIPLIVRQGSRKPSTGL